MIPMLSLSGPQLEIVMEAAAGVPVEKRGQFLERLAAMLAMRRPFSAVDVSEIIKLALTGLTHQPAA